MSRMLSLIVRVAKRQGSASDRISNAEVVSWKNSGQFYRIPRYPLQTCMRSLFNVAGWY